eukprot:283974-Rhodomonas_salina.1
MQASKCTATELAHQQSLTASSSMASSKDHSPSDPLRVVLNIAARDLTLKAKGGNVAFSTLGSAGTWEPYFPSS